MSYDVRDLARRGRLAAVAATVDGTDARRLTGAVYEVTWPVVYSHLTRRLEAQRGHHGCATSVHRLADECLDRFHDDVEAVVGDVLRRASAPLENLEAWIASRINAATVDAHRRRRGRTGALQRPRLPGWLAEALGRDPWLCTLAVEILVWVGVPATAGTSTWPLESWATRRAEETGDWRGSDPAAAARDVETVLATMRRRAEWYRSYVDVPLGHKQAPVLPGPRADPDRTTEPAALSLVGPDDADDRRLRELAALAVDAIGDRLARGVPARGAVTDVLAVVFGDGGGHDLARVPDGTPADGERAADLIAETAVTDRVVAVVLEILSEPAGR